MLDIVNIIDHSIEVSNHRAANQMSRLLSKNSPILKPQNQISNTAKNKAIDEMQAWLKDFVLEGYESRLLAVDLIDKAIMDRIKRTAPSAPEVYFTDADKIDSLVMSAKRIANDLDEAEELDKLLDCLIEDESLDECSGNSI